MLKKLRDVVAAEKLKNKGKPPKAQIHLLPNCDWVFAQNRVEKTYKEYLQKLCGRMKFEIKGFLKREFAWEKPGISIARGDWRTLQVVVDLIGKDNGRFRVEIDKKMRFGDKSWWRVWKGLVKGVEEQTGCRVNLELGRDVGVVSVSGSRDKLKGAMRLVLGE